MGFRGENMQMMVLDGGFQNIDSIKCFENLRNDNRLLGARNFVQPEKDPMRKHTHGTMVLSCIASYIPGLLVGTAPMVQVYVAQTEDGRSENRIEEDNWVAGLEYTDSLGCQVLNSSLGYTTFDDTVNQRTYADLTGDVSRASRAATIAASKGLLICNSAGNEGGKKWKYIGAPADARDILTVGAVNIKRNRAYFSSFGPTADGRIKPDACAVGRNTYISTPVGVITMADGTKFELSRELLHIYRDIMNIEGLGWQLRGNAFGLNFELYDPQGGVIAVISQKLLSLHDKYCIDIYRPEFEGIVVAILITLQHMIKDRQNAAASSSSSSSSN
jgi:hypothetical protein